MTVNTNGAERQTITPLKALTDFFNSGEGKRPMTDWRNEIKALSDEEKAELAAGAAEALGKTLTH